MVDVVDQGLALFDDLNCFPKRVTLTQYSCRVNTQRLPAFMRDWNTVAQAANIPRCDSFDLDVHTIPYHGDDSLEDKHYISKRSRWQTSILTFIARDNTSRLLYYVNAAVREQIENDEITRFAQYWKDHTGV